MTKKAAGFGMQLTHIPLLHTHMGSESGEGGGKWVLIPFVYGFTAAPGEKKKYIYKTWQRSSRTEMVVATQDYYLYLCTSPAAAAAAAP
jgi:hypothetical protein